MVDLILHSTVFSHSQVDPIAPGNSRRPCNCRISRAVEVIFTTNRPQSRPISQSNIDTVTVFKSRLQFKLQPVLPGYWSGSAAQRSESQLLAPVRRRTLHRTTPQESTQFACQRSITAARSSSPTAPRLSLTASWRRTWRAAAGRRAGGGRGSGSRRACDRTGCPRTTAPALEQKQRRLAMDSAWNWRQKVVVQVDTDFWLIEYFSQTKWQHQRERGTPSATHVHPS